MAHWTKKQFPSLERALEYLNGVMIGTVDLNPNGADVDGKTFIVHDGTSDRTVTFTPAKSRNWTAVEIVDKINAHANLSGMYLAVREVRVGAGAAQYLAIWGDPAHTIRGNGTANAELGFAEGVTPGDDTTQTIIPNTEVESFKAAARDPNQQWVVVHYS